MADNIPDTPSAIARAFAERSTISQRQSKNDEAAKARDISRTFALVAIAEALERISNSETLHTLRRHH